MQSSKLLTILLISFALCEDYKHPLFDRFAGVFGKKYKTRSQEVMASFYFKRNNDFLTDLKAMDLPFKLGITKFHDMSTDDFRKKFLTFTPDQEDIEETRSDVFLELSSQVLTSTEQLPTNVDWREKGALSKVRDQNTCGGCWAFSTISNVESQYLIKYGEPLDLSEQFLINCVTKNLACSGGNMKNALTWVISAGGLALEADQPYKNKKGTCLRPTMGFNSPLVSYFKLATKDEDEIAAYLARYGPLSAALNGDLLQFYTGGIFDKADCNADLPNHAINLVGFGEENGKRYWIVRNSWGEEWGEKGYFRLAFGKNMCGITSYVITAFVS
jgi:C1A family cysteine protease